jgi:hypothetical protein
MRTSNRRSSTARAATGPKHVPTDRRTRARLRELCDEVLASFRLASNRELFSEEERAAGRALMHRVTATEVLGTWSH